MKTIIDINGIKYNRIDITDDNSYLSDYLSKDYNYMPVYALPNELTNIEFWNNVYVIDEINLKDLVINVNKSHTINFNGYNATITLSCVKELNSNVARMAINTNGSLTTGTNLALSGDDRDTSQFPIYSAKLIPFAWVKNNEIIAVSVGWSILNTRSWGNIVTPIGYSKNSAGVIFGKEYNGITINNDNFVDFRDFDSTDTTEVGGGYGIGSMPTDNISIPDLPTVNMIDTGAALYSLTPLQMKQFRSWLWTTDWVENLKKIRTDPMQNIIGISLIDVPIPQGLNGLIYVGNVSSTVSANIVTNAFIELDCGDITLEEYYGSFADYEPFIATTLYLPKVGFVQIPADVCVNNTIKVIYHIELSSGEGLCYVQLTSKRDGFTYIWNTYTCHITSNITLSAQDHSQQLVALGNAIINTGISASNAIINPASAGQGLSNTLSSCIDVATTKNPTSTKGNVGNMSAIMCYKKPYLLINRTNLTKPTSFQENNGYLINYTSKISNHTGFLKTRDFHAEFNAPYNHKIEIERLMNEGVFING